MLYCSVLWGEERESEKVYIAALPGIYCIAVYYGARRKIVR